MHVVVTGGTGSIGSETVRHLVAEGHRVTVLSRSSRPLQEGVVWRQADALDRDQLRGVMEGVDVAISCLGASLALGPSQRAGYGQVDVPANLNLVEEAENAGVGRFIYLGVHAADGYDRTRYVLAHERVADRLEASPMSTTIIRPTGVFNTLNDFLRMARRGLAATIGSGKARTNPIHATDVAKEVVGHLSSDETDVSVGGPEVLTRREIVERAFEALGRTPRIVPAPAWIPRTMAPIVRLVHPRLGDLLAFATAVSTHDAIAPCTGEHTLLAYFRAEANRPT